MGAPTDSDEEVGVAQVNVIKDRWFVHQWLDVRDTLGKWLEAQVKAVDETGPNGSVRRVFVHYKGFKATYDEWLDTNSPRIARLHTHTPFPMVDYSVGRCQVGDRLDVQDTLGKWYSGTVLRVDPVHRLAFLHYDNWKSDFDEWINENSYRLAPLHWFTNPQLYQHHYHHQRQRTASRAPVLRLGAEDDQKVDLPTLSHSSSTQSPSPLASSAAAAASSSGPWRAPEAAEEQPQGPEPMASLSDKERRWREALRRVRGWRVVDQRGDGNCLFRGISQAIYGDPGHHGIVRARTVAYLRHERQYFQAYVAGDFSEHLEQMSKQGTWGDHLELQAMAEMYNRPIEIYAYGLQPYKTFDCGPKGAPPIRLSYHLRSHYNSIDYPELRDHLIRQPPGAIEDQALQRLQLRGDDALRRAEHMSELQALEDADIRTAVLRSRLNFQREDVASFDLAVQESVRLAEEQFRSHLHSALEVSEQELIDRVRQDSLLEGLSSSDQLSEFALAAAASSSMIVLADEDDEQEAEEQRGSAMPAGGGAGLLESQSSELARPIRLCMEMGYSLEQCVRAFSALEALGLDDLTMVGMMQEHIMDHLAQFQL